jgi:hypothetical protein
VEEQELAVDQAGQGQTVEHVHREIVCILVVLAET